MNPSSRRFSWTELAACLSLAGLTVFFLAISWRKWPDPLIDFGKELYTPWRIANGAVLYRDAGEFYGPLSKYLNAGLFSIFGPGMMVLVAANLVVFSGIVTLLYLLVRRAWGRGAAWLSSALFVAVFGFSQFTGIGNYTYAAPYSHEATHGILVCLALVLVLSHWIENPTLVASAQGGALFGTTLLLKPEIILPAALLTLAAVFLRWMRRLPVPFVSIAIWACCAALPTLAFAVYFRTHTDWGTAFSSACRAWMSVVTDDVTGNLNQSVFIGFDHWKRNLLLHGIATLSAILLVAGIGVASSFADKSADRGRRMVVGSLLVAAVAGLAFEAVNWQQTGRCLLGLILLYLILGAATLKPGASFPPLRFLLAVLAAGLMARMLLNGRIYQYGFFQAALAGVLLPAIIVFELPDRLAFGAFGRRLMMCSCLVLFAVGAITLCDQSNAVFSKKTFAIGSGSDRFFSFDPEIDPRGPFILGILDRLSQSPPGQALLVLPEGEMINYLLRMPNPLPPAFFFGATLSNGREEALAAQLRADPPDWIVFISRDLRGYGIQKYGEVAGQGLDLVTFARNDYRQELSLGGDPFSVGETGAILLKRAPSR